MVNYKLTLNIAEVCELTGVSRPLVDSWIKRKVNPLPCIKTSRRYCVPRAALEQWLLEEANRNSGITK